MTEHGLDISPANLEAKLKLVPLIGQAAVIGDERPFVSALVVLEKAGHIGQVEAPKIFFPAIDTFLKGSFPAAAKTIKHP